MNLLGTFEYTIPTRTKTIRFCETCCHKDQMVLAAVAGDAPDPSRPTFTFVSVVILFSSTYFSFGDTQPLGCS